MAFSIFLDLQSKNTIVSVCMKSEQHQVLVESLHSEKDILFDSTKVVCHFQNKNPKENDAGGMKVCTIIYWMLRPDQ